MPTQGRSLQQEDNGMVKKWKWRKSLYDGLGWKYKTWCKNPGDSPQKGEGWRRKENVSKEATTKMKNIDKWRTNNKMKIKNEE